MNEIIPAGDIPLRNKIATFCEKIYQLYPKKMGKTEGISRLKRQLKTIEDCQDFQLAMGRFVNYHMKEGTEKKFIPYFSSFVTNWRDWLDDSVGECEELKKEELSYAARKMLQK